MTIYFFRPSREAAAEITSIFNFVWPTAAALWNLRWQIGGYLDAVPDATVPQLNERFVRGSGLHGADLRRACITTSWDDQKERFASLILVNAFAVYESWAEAMVRELQVPFRNQRFQFPDSAATNGVGLESTIASLLVTPSPVLDAAYFPIFSVSDKYAWSILPNLLLAYRYFKEIRNCQMHGGGAATQKAEDAYQAFAPFSDRLALGMKGALVIEPVVVGTPVRLHLRGVVGFCDILLRIIATVDAELCRSPNAERIFRRDLAAVRNAPSTLSGEQRRRRYQVALRCVQAGYPRPKATDTVYAFLRSERLIQV